jgi:hypothetical protein
VSGLVTIEGSSADARYLSNRIEVRRVGAQDSTVIDSSTVAVAADTLATWDTSHLPDGDYEIRLLVQDSLGVEGTALVRVIVDNVAPFANVTSPVVVRPTQGGDVFTTGAEVHVYVPPHGFDDEATVSLEPDTIATASLPDGASLAAPGWQLTWGQAQLVRPGILEMRVPTGESRPLAVYTERTPGTWVRLGGAPTAVGAPLAVSLTAPGRYALYAGGAPGFTSSLGSISLVPRAFSPRGSFGSRDVAIGFTLGRSGSVSVKVFNRAGRLLRVVADGLGLPAGAGVVRWDGRDRDGQTVEAGLYLVTVEALGERATQTLAVVR